MREANAFGADLVVEIHCNSGGGDGAEVFYSRVGGKSKTLAQNILNEICKLGQQSRGVKTKIGSSGRDYFGMIRDTNAPAVLVECAFLDTKDVHLIDTPAERVKMGESIARGILLTLGIKDAQTNAQTMTDTNKPSSTSSTSFKVKILDDCLNIRRGAGTSYAVVGQIKDHGVYTIVEVKGTFGKSGSWGKLKSGAGYISLYSGYVKKV